MKPCGCFGGLRAWPESRPHAVRGGQRDATSSMAGSRSLWDPLWEASAVDAELSEELDDEATNTCIYHY